MISYYLLSLLLIVRSEVRIMMLIRFPVLLTAVDSTDSIQPLVTLEFLHSSPAELQDIPSYLTHTSSSGVVQNIHTINEMIIANSSIALSYRRPLPLDSAWEVWTRVDVFLDRTTHTYPFFCNISDLVITPASDNSSNGTLILSPNNPDEFALDGHWFYARTTGIHPWKGRNEPGQNRWNSQISRLCLLWNHSSCYKYSVSTERNSCFVSGRLYSRNWRNWTWHLCLTRNCPSGVPCGAFVPKITGSKFQIHTERNYSLWCKHSVDE